MVKIIKTGKVVIVLSGRYAGRKAVVVKAYDEGTKERPFPHALVSGLDRYPQRVTKKMSNKKVQKRSKVKPFIKFINYNHIMPTRYTVDMDVRSVVTPAAMQQPDTRIEARKEVKTLFENRYLEGKRSMGVQYFFNKLRF